MKLVALIAILSATSKKLLFFSRLMEKSACLSRLSLENKRQAQKKPNEINACRLVALVAPTEDADADKRRPPVGAIGTLKDDQEIRNRGKATSQRSTDNLSKMIRLTFRGYLNANVFQGGVR